eukprot:11363036-Alexandrium_andersonii.AAC.1
MRQGSPASSTSSGGRWGSAGLFSPLLQGIVSFGFLGRLPVARAGNSELWAVPRAASASDALGSVPAGQPWSSTVE